MSIALAGGGEKWSTLCTGERSKFIVAESELKPEILRMFYVFHVL